MWLLFRLGPSFLHIDSWLWYFSILSFRFADYFCCRIYSELICVSEMNQNYIEEFWRSIPVSSGPEPRAAAPASLGLFIAICSPWNRKAVGKLDDSHTGTEVCVHVARDHEIPTCPVWAPASLSHIQSSNSDSTGVISPASLLPLEQARHAPNSRPLQFLFPCSRMLFPICQHGSRLTSFKSHLKGHLLREVFPATPFNMMAPSLPGPFQLFLYGS